MPPELPNNQRSILRRRTVAVIDRAQEEAMRELLKAGVPETHALSVMRRINAFCLETLKELDAIFRQFDEFVAADGRSEANQQWLNDKATALLLQLESAVASLVAETTHKILHEPVTQPERPREVITVPAKPTQSPWEKVLRHVLRHLVWVVGVAVWVLSVWQATTGGALLTVLGFVLAVVLWRSSGSFWWSVLFAMGVPAIILLL